jgi:hypothetical protein
VDARKRARARNASARRPSPGHSGQSSLSLSPRRRAGGLVQRLCLDRSTKTRVGLLLVLCHAFLPGFCSPSALFPLFTGPLALCLLSPVTPPLSR